MHFRQVDHLRPILVQIGFPHVVIVHHLCARTSQAFFFLISYLQCLANTLSFICFSFSVIWLLSHHGSFSSVILCIMKFQLIAVLLAATAQSVDALSALSTRMGIATSTITATSFETATSTITSISEITSVATTCAVGSTAPMLQQYYLSSCNESVWSSAGQYWRQYCSASLVGGTTVRTYALSALGYNYAASICGALNNLNIPPSKCAGINVMRAGAIGVYYLVHGDVSVTSATLANAFTNNAIALYTTNPCEITETATTTDFYPVAETNAVVYTSTYEVTYLETITVQVPDPSATSSSTTSTCLSSPSSSAIPLNTTGSAAATTLTYPLVKIMSTLPVITDLNTTASSIILSIPETSLKATTSTLVPIVVNATTTSSAVLSTSQISPNITTQILVTFGINASSTAVQIAALPVDNATIINTSSSSYTSNRPSLSSNIHNTSSIVTSGPLNSTISAHVSSSTYPSALFLNTTASLNIQATTSSSPTFQNITSSNSAHMPYLTSSASAVIGVPALSSSASTQTISASVSRHESQAPVTLTSYITAVSTVTACPPEVTDCPASQKTTFLATKTIATYSTLQTAAPTQAVQATGVHTLEYATAINNDISNARYTTSTLYSTSIQSVTACPSSVKDCPASKKTVYQTEIVKAYTTVCPVVALSNEAGLRATSSIISLPMTSPTSIASSFVSVDHAHTQSQFGVVPSALLESSAFGSSANDSYFATLLTVGETRTTLLPER